jgi:hypothetical protein
MILLCGERVLSWKIVRDAALFMAQCAFDIFSKGVADTLRDAGTPIVDPLSIKGVFHLASIAALDSIHVVEQKPLVKRKKSKATVTNDKKAPSSQNDGSASMTSSKESLEMLPTAETRALQQLEEERRAHMPSLLELLAIGQDAERLEPKDKVYGLQEIRRMPKAARIIPEYSLSTTAVYTQYTTSIIPTAKNLDILTLREGIKTDLSPPS